MRGGRFFFQGLIAGVALIMGAARLTRKWVMCCDAVDRRRGWPPTRPAPVTNGFPLGKIGYCGACSVTALASSKAPFLTWRPLMAVKVVSPVSGKLHIPSA